MPDVRHLQRFVAVAQELSFRRAAHRLHMSQPPLSDSIRQLEEEIGTPLLSRTRRSVALTRPGEVFLESAQRLLAQLDEAVSEARAVAGGASGHLTIGFYPSASYDILPRLVRGFRERCPGIVLKFEELTTPEQPEALLRKRIDVGLFIAPTVSRPGIAQEVLLKEPLFAVLARDHPLARRKRLRLEHLSNEPFIFIPPRWGTGYHARISAACQQAGFTPTVAYEVEHLHTMVGLAAAGLGVALGAASLRRLQPPGVVFKAFDDPAFSLHLDCGIAWREHEASAPVERFLAIARQVGKGGYTGRR